MTSSLRLLSAIEMLGTHKFTAASIAKAESRHPGVPLLAMVSEAKMFASELKETMLAIGKTIDRDDPQMKLIDHILAVLG